MMDHDNVSDTIQECGNCTHYQQLSQICLTPGGKRGLEFDQPCINGQFKDYRERQVHQYLGDQTNLSNKPCSRGS